MQANDKTVWWRQPWPWFLMALPMSAIVGGIVTIWLAMRSADSLVSDDYYKEGLAIRQVLDRDAKAKALGIAATLNVQGGQVTLVLAGETGKPEPLQFHLVHTTRAEQDIVLSLQPGPDRHFVAALPAMQAGKRQLILEPADRSWRLMGEWRNPFVGQLKLEPCCK